MNDDWRLPLISPFLARPRESCASHTLIQHQDHLHHRELQQNSPSKRKCTCLFNATCYVFDQFCMWQKCNFHHFCHHFVGHVGGFHKHWWHLQIFATFARKGPQKACRGRLRLRLCCWSCLLDTSVRVALQTLSWSLFVTGIYHHPAGLLGIWMSPGYFAHPTAGWEQWNFSCGCDIILPCYAWLWTLVSEQKSGFHVFVSVWWRVHETDLQKEWFSLRHIKAAVLLDAQTCINLQFGK